MRLGSPPVLLALAVASGLLVAARHAAADAGGEPHHLGQCEDAAETINEVNRWRPGCVAPRRTPERGQLLDPRRRSIGGDAFGPFAEPLGPRHRRAGDDVRIEVLTRMALRGERPRFPDWSRRLREISAEARRRDPFAAPADEEVETGRFAMERFEWMAAPLRPEFRLLPVSVPDEEIWSANLEGSIDATGACFCPGGSGGSGDPTSGGRVPDGIVQPGTLLTVARNEATPGDLDLAWGASCSSTANSYAVYEGALGSYFSHDPHTCSTGGQTNTTITPSAGSHYYLIVPQSPDNEGGYGTESSGQPRPAGASPCKSSRRTVC